MPSTSKAQARLMAAAAHNPKFAKKVGVPTSVAKEFNAADKGKRFGTGGNVNYSYGGEGQINKPRTRFGSKFGYKLNAPNENLSKYVGKKEGGSVMDKKDLSQDKKMVKKAVTMHDKQLHGGKKTDLTKLAKGGQTMAKKVDPRVARMLASRTAVAQDPSKARAAAPMFSKGGRTASKGEHDVQTKSKRGAEMVKMARGGVARTVTKEMEYDYKTGKKSFGGSTAQRDAHAEKEGKRVAKDLAYDKSKKFARGGGIETKGKTKGTMITMKKGGSC